MASSIGLVGVLSQPTSPIRQENYGGFNSSIFKMKKELNEIKKKLVYMVYSNNERHLLQSKIEFQMQKIKKKEVEYKQFKGRIKSNSGIDTEGYESDDPRNVQLTKADLKIGKPSIDPGTKLVAYNSEYVSRMFGFRNHQRNGINRTVMGPHRKSRKRLEEYFEDEFKPLEITSALQSISIAKRNLNQAPHFLWKIDLHLLFTMVIVRFQCQELRPLIYHS